MQNLESVPVEEMDTKFCEVGDQFVNHILSQESTKSIYGKAVTGRMFLILVETYLATISKGWSRAKRGDRSGLHGCQ